MRRSRALSRAMALVSRLASVAPALGAGATGETKPKRII
jgi:hypothetical protein